jgi:hypothetical protein
VQENLTMARTAVATTTSKRRWLLAAAAVVVVAAGVTIALVSLGSSPATHPLFPPSVLSALAADGDTAHLLSSGSQTGLGPAHAQAVADANGQTPSSQAPTLALVTFKDSPALRKTQAVLCWLVLGKPVAPGTGPGGSAENFRVTFVDGQTGGFLTAVQGYASGFTVTPAT